MAGSAVGEIIGMRTPCHQINGFMLEGISLSGGFGIFGARVLADGI